MICTNSVELYKGERRVVVVEITACDTDVFTIRNPKYKLLRGDVVETEGIPSLDEHELTIVLEPIYSGRYVLECTVEIANEIVIRRIPVYVRN